ncbi:uncharacterized protein K460DRAFT_354746 [Cucurbitaria berberidis CBS 394.84]|uniref:C2H2-type domain-containing protein n=1 Tax=Cucurbitaria berberidis CBS 394.84 TaxID=1168544 RepID=A0A9P4GG03_9PLEO|nr:uncharacterized protein K460DRAFT_354746 [Cucurbitaria berberidis CBS 394.84]KAF1844875.1 hypothetical protein K460DRAFT_354746 [Cucurbitaria berberidis CBS 394.84]
MDDSVSEQCLASITNLKTIFLILSNPSKQNGRIHPGDVNDELERFSLWTGNIGAMHLPASPMSIESRLSESNDVLMHILELLSDVKEVTGELLEIVSGQREGGATSTPHDDGEDEAQIEETELLKEIGACVTRLFRISSLIRQATPTDLFAKALSRTRYQFDDQYDVAHVGEKYPKLATHGSICLRKILGRAITRRRHYLSYIQDHREKLQSIPTNVPEVVASKSQVPNQRFAAMKLQPDTFSRPSTFITKASSLAPGNITTQMLTAEVDSNSESDARSYTTISSSVQGDLDSSATNRIPKLAELQPGAKKEVECPFCFRIKRIKNERVWRRHVYSDLRAYVCTFPNCDAPYFNDVNEWFRHEMQNHRVNYTCRFCPSETFRSSEQYLNHIRNKHPSLLKDGEEKSLTDFARTPLEKISAQECPCCSDWVDRLKKRAEVAEMLSNTSDHMIYVDPIIFKRHVASHLEQLASFAIPINLSGGEDVDSNAAVELGADLRNSRSNSFSSLSSLGDLGGKLKRTIRLDDEMRKSPCSMGMLLGKILGKWYTLDGSKATKVCSNCYDCNFARTPFASSFSRTDYQGAIGQACDFNDPWVRFAWLLTVQQKRQSLDLLYDIDKIIDSEQPCPSDRAVGLGSEHLAWYGLAEQEYDLDVAKFTLCERDVKLVEALFPSIIGYFARLPKSSRNIICSLRINSRRHPKYLELLAELDAEAEFLGRSLNISAFIEMLRMNALRSECPGNIPSVNRLWHFMPSLPEFTVCEECYEDIVRPVRQPGTSTIPSRLYADLRSIPDEDPELGTSCSLYSPNMRGVWERSIAEEDFEYLKRKAVVRKRLEARLKSMWRRAKT